MGNEIRVIDVFENATISASGTLTSEKIELHAYNPYGNFGLQVGSVGSGSVIDFEYLVSNDGVTFVVPDGASDIKTGHAEGNAYYDFSPVLAKHLKIRATETSGNAVTDLDVKLAIQ